MMAYPIYTECPDVGYGYSDQLPVEVLKHEGPGVSDRVSLYPRPLRTFRWNYSDRDSARIILDQFFVWLIGVGRDLFLVKDPKDFARTGVPLTLVSGTTYALPDDNGEESPYYPADDAAVQCYDDGSPVAHTSVDTDGRTITLTAAPSGVVTADYTGLRLCRLSEGFDWDQQAQSWFSTSLQIEEVLPDEDS